MQTTYTFTLTGRPWTETMGNGDEVVAAYNYDGTLSTSTETTSAAATGDSHVLTYDGNNNITNDVVNVQSADNTATSSTTWAPAASSWTRTRPRGPRPARSTTTRRAVSGSA